MTELELAQRLGVALAIGALVGAERHWRDRAETDGQRTAGLRTFTLIGALGGLAAALDQALGATAPRGLLLSAMFLGLSAVFGLFQYREQVAEGRFSVTTVVAAMATFALGAFAVIGDLRIAGAGGVILVGILAAREALHRFVEALTFAELRAAIVLLAMTFVILPLVPSEPIGPFGGVSPTRIWTLAILLAAISFVGYAAAKLLGERHGELVAGAVGGLLSSTAATITNARRSADGGDAKRLAAGALAAGVVSYLRTGLIIATLAPNALPLVGPALGAGALIAAGAALALARQDAGEHAAISPTNPFDLWRVIQLAVLLGAIAFATRAAAAWFGDAGVFAISALSGLADVDAPVITAAGLAGKGLNVEVAALAMLVAIAANTVAKAAYGLALGSGRFGIVFAGVSALALGAGVATFIALAALG
ncbi:DUF4010 domain-containing protein [Phreatobacter sp.]|uniref:MgtC/SapB family protein n=1 Tax=Phreatobacter sp. TaxID=1966341 RepID=UPI0022C01962|nr:DUF4010 domain-containing protein [Phreatobacter sp.]MCZ8314749.1 DUF4010 domain-containing protein [Phreatobacter sp.]